MLIRVMEIEMLMMLLPASVLTMSFLLDFREKECKFGKLLKLFQIQCLKKRERSTPMNPANAIRKAHTAAAVSLSGRIGTG